MSYYYNYYLGYKTVDNKIYPLGPYDYFGKLHNVLSRSRSFASDLYEDFHHIKEEEISDELRKEFEYEDWNGNKRVDVKYLLAKELPASDYIKTGYYLIEDIHKYFKEKDSWDLFYERLDPVEYTMKMETELKFGLSEPKKDCEGYDISQYSCRDYAYFSYPDYSSKEYESFVIKTTINALEYLDYKLKDGSDIVVLETEG